MTETEYQKNEENIKTLQEAEGDVEYPADFPRALRNLQLRQYALAFAIAVLAVAFVLCFKSVKYLVLLLIAVFMAWKGIEVGQEYRKGNIVEDVLVCQNVRKATVRDNIIVTFSSTDDNPRYVQFTLPGRRTADRFIPGAAYLVYYNINSTSVLLGYMPV